MQYLVFLFALYCIYLLLASTLNISMGYAGMLSLCHAVFFGVGAYTYSYTVTQLNSTALTGILAAVLLSGFVATVFGIVCNRLRQDEFLLATIALQLLFTTAVRNCTEVTGGPFGIAGIPPVELLIDGARSTSGPIVAILTLTILSFAIVVLFARSRFSLRLQACRDDEIVSSVHGISPSWVRLVAFALGASIASVSGVMYATLIGYIDPSSFELSESIVIFSMVVLGGLSSFSGPFLGAAFVIFVPEFIRFLPVSSNYEANIKQIVYGVALLLVVCWWPRGFLGRYALEDDE